MSLETALFLLPFACLIIMVVLLAVVFAQYRDIKVQLQMSAKEFKVLHGTSLGMGQRIIALEKKLQGLHQSRQSTGQSKQLKMPEQKDPLQPQAVSDNLTSESETSLSSYDKARRELLSGRSVSEVASSCHLSHAEVSLLHTLNQKAPMSFSEIGGSDS